ncbi:cytochrome c biogenesis protein CcdA [Candidatus Microgenomates bacterium]|nr:cytochrome c biogenesis protein CcdA [Candidatus Microgenomates bacterium]
MSLLKTKLLLLFLAVFTLFNTHSTFAQEKTASETTAEIFYSEACSDCGPYLNKTLLPALKDYGIEVAVKDYIGNPNFRVELSSRIEQEKIPQDIIGHMMTFIKRSSDDQKSAVILAGHVPDKIITDALTARLSSQTTGQVLIWQDEMHGTIKNYRVWTGGEVKTYDINTPISEALKDFQGQQVAKAGEQFLLPTVLISGFLDGLNPCAFAILLFLIAFIFMLKKSRLSVFKYGGVYITAIYLTYLLIGLGIWKAVIFTSTPHLMAKIGAILVIVLGFVNLLNFFFPRFPISLRIPMPGKQKILDLMHKGTLPTTLLLGIFVGLCTFPCSGGIYVAIVTLLAAKTTASLGLIYLLIYNLMFILPLVLILGATGNRIIVEKMTNFEEQNEPRMRLIYGLTMIGIGVIILFYFI